MPAWYEAFSCWATTCENVDGYNIGAEQKCHRHSFLTFAAGRGATILNAKWAGLSEKPWEYLRSRIVCKIRRFFPPGKEQVGVSTESE